MEVALRSATGVTRIQLEDSHNAQALVRCSVGSFPLLDYKPSLCRASGLLPSVREWQTLTPRCRSFMRLLRNGEVGTPEEHRDGALCQGYVEGVFDSASFGHLFASNFMGIAICVPHDIYRENLTEVVATFLEQNPALDAK